MPGPCPLLSAGSPPRLSAEETEDGAGSGRVPALAAAAASVALSRAAGGCAATLAAGDAAGAAETCLAAGLSGDGCSTADCADNHSHAAAVATSPPIRAKTATNHVGVSSPGSRFRTDPPRASGQAKEPCRAVTCARPEPARRSPVAPHALAAVAAISRGSHRSKLHTPRQTPTPPVSGTWKSSDPSRIPDRRTSR